MEHDQVIREGCERLRAELEAAEAQRYRQEYPDSAHPADRVTLRERRDFYALDIGTSGAFMVRKADGAVFGIKGYGTPDYRKGIGFLSGLDGVRVLGYRYARGPFRTDMRDPRGVSA